MTYIVRTGDYSLESKFELLDNAINCAVRCGNAIVCDCITQSMIAATHKINGEVFINRLFNGRMMHANALELRQRELGNMPLLKGDTSLEMLGWKDIS